MIEQLHISSPTGEATENMSEVAAAAQIRARQKAFDSGRGWICRQGDLVVRQWPNGQTDTLARIERFDGGLNYFRISDGQEYLSYIRYDNGQLIEFESQSIIN